MSGASRWLEARSGVRNTAAIVEATATQISFFTLHLHRVYGRRARMDLFGRQLPASKAQFPNAWIVALGVAALGVAGLGVGTCEVGSWELELNGLGRRRWCTRQIYRSGRCRHSARRLDRDRDGG